MPINNSSADSVVPVVHALNNSRTVADETSDVFFMAVAHVVGQNYGAHSCVFALAYGANNTYGEIHPTRVFRANV